MDFSKDFEKLHLQNIAFGDKQVTKIIHQVSIELAKEIQKWSLVAGDSFSIQNYKPLKNKINRIIGEMNSDLSLLTTSQMTKAWALSNRKNDYLANQYLANIGMTEGIKQTFFQINSTALDAFINRTENAFTISDRIWRSTAGIKDELETYVGHGIATGKSAQTITKDVRGLLKEPDKVFRRVRDKNGNLVLSKPAKAYRPVKGVYRSSYKNALRLTRTETNMAYRLSDAARRKQLPFVTGITVHLSAAHSQIDICDEMQGKYPKGFQFSGWHPNCFCYSTADLLPKEKFIEMLDGKPAPIKYYRMGAPKRALTYLANVVAKSPKSHYFTQAEGTFNASLTGMAEGVEPTLVNLKLPKAAKPKVLKPDYDIYDDYETANDAVYDWSYDKAPQAVLDSVSRYTGSHYSDINDLLRIPNWTVGRSEVRIQQVKKHVDNIKLMYKDAPRYKGTVYRGMTWFDETSKGAKALLPNLKKGNIITDPGFMSTTTREGIAKGFADWDRSTGARKLRVVFEIDTENGVPIRNLSQISSEDEILLNCGSSFIIKDIDEKVESGIKKITVKLKEL